MKRLLTFLIVLTTTHSQAQDAKGSKYWSAAIYYDQDYTLEQFDLNLNEDRNYTMGLGISIAFPELKKSFLYVPHRLLNRLFNKRYLNDKSNSNPNVFNSMMIGNGSFTPDSLPASYVIRNDRPYGSITYLQTVTAHVNSKSFRQHTTTFSAGLIGTGLSKELQVSIHKSMNDNDTRNPRTPRGWGNQISNGGELTVCFTAEEERLITKKKVSQEKHTSTGGIELKHSWKYSIGYYTGFNYGLNFRLGKTDPRNWTYRVNALGSSDKNALHHGNSPGDYYTRDKTCEFYLFGSLRPTFMLYNAMLNGQFRYSAMTLNFTDMRHFTAEFDGGGAVSIPIAKQNLLELKIRLSGRSPEFELPGRPPRWHYWGGLDISFSHY